MKILNIFLGLIKNFFTKIVKNSNGDKMGNFQDLNSLLDNNTLNNIQISTNVDDFSAKEIVFINGEKYIRGIKIIDGTPYEVYINEDANDVSNFYRITYDLKGGILHSGDENPENYNINTESFTLNNPEKNGYYFLGWSGTEICSDEVTIQQGSTGNRKYIANWELNADFQELNALIEQIEGYQQANILPANNAHDPRYAAGGDFALLLESDGTYPWDDFDTTALTIALANGKECSDRGLPQSEQTTVDTLTTELLSALNNLTLLDADYTVTYECTHSTEGYYEDFSSMYYPPCESGMRHSYNSVKELIDALLNTPDEDSFYTTDSLAELRIAVYGDSNNAGIVQEAEEEELKLPAQEFLQDYVDRLAEAYHTIPVLKDADYSKITWLITDYLEQTKQVRYEDLMNYYTTSSVQELQMYYAGINKKYKKTRQSLVDGRIYNELKSYVDALVAKPADYSSIYTQILYIPKGGNFSYPSGSVADAAWVAWTSANAGHISQAIDTEFLNTHYEARTVAVLNDVLDWIDWTLDIFDQAQINGSLDVTYEKCLQTAIDVLVRRTYTITYMMNDGSNSTFTTMRGYYYGETIQLPMSNPARINYVFAGWSHSAVENIPVTSIDTVSGNMVFYASWEYTNVS